MKSLTFINPNDDCTSNLRAQKSLLQTLPSNINSIFLNPISLSDLPKDTKLKSRIALSINRSLPQLKQTLTTLNKSNLHLSAFTVDILGIFAVDIAREHNIPPYIFFFSNAMALSLVLHLSKLDESITCDFMDLNEPISLPGCIPLKRIDLPDHIQDKTNEAYRFALEKCKKYRLVEGIIVNSFRDLELEVFRAFKDGGWCNVPVYPVGPVVQSSGLSSSVDYLKWLDNQPDGSVFYVSFGSGWTLSYNQLMELAFGLEMNGQRFLWLVKSPDEKGPNATFFTRVLGEDKKQGIGRFIVAPQGLVLSYCATGGFLMHCGWNSCLDGIENGVPFIAWPLFAEQRMNAAFLTEGLKVSLRVEVNEDGIVERKLLGKLLKELIGGEEGKEIAKRMGVVKDGAKKAWSENGSSKKGLGELAYRWIGES
ncbi:UDP-glucuronosyl and UDP-glucosyl transferase [Handroanthus impetiginosus]|uniref:UDP-glucuronosyl and UDP-glucosyl transferase n=1 Tax=Handroanthus impetiginosus TaxID=429701 RepID=A0A2G9HD04_9LAMI|nr:UDP-glucuronosyl and UDP-glucosyl transferase [Handroanthus impetiginosus]